MAFCKVMPLSELWIGEKRAEIVNGRPVLLVHHENGVFAYANRCAHRGLPLHDGRLEGAVLTCPVHEWRYDVCTGRGINPESACLVRYPVRIEDDCVFVDTDADPRGDAP
jgi:toluene monooxygenase system ferredoxin subunit